MRRAEESLAALRAHLQEEETEPPSAAWFGRMGGVLSEIEDRGGEVSVQDLREIGIRHGYDPRGMGGFLSGLSPLSDPYRGVLGRLIHEYHELPRDGSGF